MKNYSSTKPYIIAEAGTNHNGYIDTALKLVDLAKNAHAHSVKFQIINPEGLYVPSFYDNGNYKPNPIIEQRKKFMLKDYDYKRIANYAIERGIDFSASVFDDKSLNLLLKYNPPYIKVASCDLNNISFLKKVAERATEKKVRIILSTGMSTLSEIERSISEIFKTGFQDIVLLHCVSVYPAKLSQMNLGFIDVLKNTFALPIGLSDHTSNSIAAAIALSKGATYFEKHITLDKTQEGFDHTYALEEPEFVQYVVDIYNAYEALQNRQMKLTQDEINIKKRARRSLYAARELKKGEVIREKDILIVRPEAKMGADEIDIIIGKRCRTTIMQYQPFSIDKVF
jgi:sialic acid synthase SpsE